MKRLWPLVCLYVGAGAAQTVATVVARGAGAGDESTDYAAFYEPVARHILAGEGITIHGRLATRYPPGFPVFLAAVFRAGDACGVDRGTAVLAANVFLAGLAALLLFRVGRMAFNDRAAFVAAALWATYPFNLWLGKQPNTEPLYIPLFLAGVLATLAAGRRGGVLAAAAGGLCFAAAALVRPAGILLAGVGAAVLLAARSLPPPRRVAAAAVTLVVFAGAVAPWVVAASRAEGRFIPLATGGPASVVDGLTFAARRQTPTFPDLPADVREWMIRAQRDLGYAAPVGVVARYLARRLAAEPTATVKIFIFKLARSWYGTTAAPGEGYIALAQTFYLTLAAAGVIMAARRRALRWEVAAAGAFVTYCYAATVAVLSILRYMVPAMALAMVFAGYGVDKIFTKPKDGGN